VRTPNAVAGIRGTAFRTWAGVDGTTLVAVVEGKVEVSAKGKKVVVEPEQATEVALAEPPRAPEKRQVEDRDYKVFASKAESNLAANAGKIANQLAVELAAASAAVKLEAETKVVETEATDQARALEVRRLEQQVAALEAQLGFIEQLHVRAASKALKAKNVGAALKKVELKSAEVQQANRALKSGSKRLLQVRPLTSARLKTAPARATDAAAGPALKTGVKVAAVAPRALKTATAVKAAPRAATAKTRTAGTARAAPVGARPAAPIAGGTMVAAGVAPKRVAPVTAAPGTKKSAAMATVDLPPAEGKKAIPLPKLVKRWKTVTLLCNAFDRLERDAAAVAGKNPYEFPTGDKKRHILHYARQAELMKKELQKLVELAAGELAMGADSDRTKILLGEKARGATYIKRIAQRIKALKRQATTYK